MLEKLNMTHAGYCLRMCIPELEFGVYVFHRYIMSIFHIPLTVMTIYCIYKSVAVELIGMCNTQQQ